MLYYCPSSSYVNISGGIGAPFFFICTKLRISVRRAVGTRVERAGMGVLRQGEREKLVIHEERSMEAGKKRGGGEGEEFKDG